MKRDTFRPLQSSFLSHGKDAETIIKKLFVECPAYGNDLKKLLVINTKDCLNNKDNTNYFKIVEDISVSKLMESGYLSLIPKIRISEHEEVKSYIIINFNDYFPSATNSPEFRDSTLAFDIICHTDYWLLDNYEIRPLKIAGYIDGMINECKLSGIGTLNFMGCKEVVFDNELAGYTLMYNAVHGSDDRIPHD